MNLKIYSRQHVKKLTSGMFHDIEWLLSKTTRLEGGKFWHDIKSLQWEETGYIDRVRQEAHLASKDKLHKHAFSSS